jgi:hypothetical protein
MQDPTRNGLKANAGFPPHWTARLEELLGLPGDMRRHAIVMAGFQMTWLFTIDPTWTGRQLLPLVDTTSPDTDALWEGLLRAGQLPSKDLFLKLKSGLAEHVTDTHRRHEKTVLAGFLLAGWGSETDRSERLVTDSELREILIHADDEFRQQLLWRLEQWSSEPNGIWRARVIPFFRHVWPKQRALRTPAMSGHLANFVLAVGDLMPTLVSLVLPRLIPVRNSHFWFKSEGEGSLNHAARAYPLATLDLLWAVLGEDASLWPHRVGEALDLLEQAADTASDLRLQELRRRFERA